MTSPASRRTAARRADAPMLQWVFNRVGHDLTCELDATADGAFAVRLVPQWNTRGTRIERFPNLLSAVERHAELARALGDAGWRLLAHLHPHAGPAAA